MYNMMKKALFNCLSLLLTSTLCINCSYNDYYESVDKVSSDSTSIFVGTDRHENGAGNNLTALLQTVTNNLNVKSPDLVLLGGDYVGGPYGGVKGQPTFDLSDVAEEIEAVLGKTKCSSLLTYGSHDRNASEGYSAFFSGPHACDGYYTYGISYAQMYYATDSATTAIDSTYTTETVTDTIDGNIVTDTIKTLEDTLYRGLDLHDPFGISAESATLRFTSWVKSLSDNAPIIMMSHLPIHACRKDNPGALQWFNAISEAAKQHDIILFFGHNHTMESLGYDTDKYHYLLTPGDSIYVEGENSTTWGKVLNFTYANAGYIKVGYSSLVTLYDTNKNGTYDKMRIRRYSVKDGDTEYFGLTGKKNPYTINFSKSK